MSNAKPQDWHPADVKAALEKKGLRLTDVSRGMGLYHNTAHRVLYHAYPAVELEIARILGVHPAEIWPSRYGADGLPRYQRRPKHGTVQTRPSTRLTA